MSRKGAAATVDRRSAFAPGSTYQQVYNRLTAGAVQPSPFNNPCGNVANSKKPNNVWGYGMVNAYKSITAP